MRRREQRKGMNRGRKGERIAKGERKERRGGKRRMLNGDCKLG